ncbi:MAG: hypothetical protein HPAVJP_2560 [Candidatus Hepatoplasma vulgare]|nr:MAG: hypothetical protein HPAVJP_2560 [Candidatus Hepatoplasma sp.]
MNYLHEFDLRNRENRIFFIYKYYLLKLDIEEAKKELHQNLEEYDFTLEQQNAIEKIFDNIPYIEKLIKEKSLNWDWSRIDYLEKSVLINGSCEIIIFKNKKQIVINESVIFAKKYCNIDSYKYINGILDKLK